MATISSVYRCWTLGSKRSARFGVQSQRHYGVVPLRDLIELQNRPSIIRRHDFFSQHGRTQSYGKSHTEERLLDYDPILTQCIARWLWLHYKITDYPYYDLNIFNVFTDLPQSVYFMRKIMQYFHQVLPAESFTRINYYLIPLYRCSKTDKEHLLRDIPGNVHLIEETTLFPLNKPLGPNYRDGSEIFIHDPVRVLMFNDIFPKLAQDLVRYDAQNGKWEQCYGGSEAGTPLSLQFSSDLDYWCDHTLKSLYGSESGVLNPDGRETNANGVYIPTQFVQLLEQLKVNAPDYRLFAIDTPKHHHPGTFASRIRRFFTGGRECESQPAYTDPRNIAAVLSAASQAPGASPTKIRFRPNFDQLQTITNHINDSDTHGVFPPCQTETLGAFCDKWVDVKVKQRTDRTNALPQEFLDRLQLQLELARRSPLAIMHT